MKLYDAANLECEYVSTRDVNGDGIKNDGHGWVIAKIDGEWYMIDPTWDDPTVRGITSIVSGYERHDYFNITDEILSQDHKGYSANHACTSLAANYYTVNLGQTWLQMAVDTLANHTVFANRAAGNSSLTAADLNVTWNHRSDSPEKFAISCTAWMLNNASLTLGDGAMPVFAASYDSLNGPLSVSWEFAASNPIVAEGDCGDDLTWTLDKDGVLTISGTGDMDNYTGPFEMHTAPWNNYGDQITSIVIQEGVTSVGEWAFLYTQAETISLPESLQRIGEGGCVIHTLTSLHIPAGVVSIAPAALNTQSLCELTIDESNAVYTVVDNVLFSKDMSQLHTHPAGLKSSSYTVPDSVTTIEAYAFDYNESLHSVTLPQHALTIGEGAFRYCSGLTSLVLPEGIERIEGYTFYYCTGLTSITLPASLTYVGPQAFCEVSVEQLQITYLGSEPQIALIDTDE